MGKNAKLREERKQSRLAEMEILEEKNAKQKKVRTLRTIIIAAVAVVAVVAIGLGVFFGVIVKQPWYLRNTVMMETQNVKVDGMMMAYYIYSSYQTDLQNAGDMGIDTSAKLKDQYYRGISWFDLFAAETKAQMQQVMLFAEKAKEQGMTLTEEERKAQTEYLDSVDLTAYNQAIGLTKEDLQRTMELSELATKMYTKMVEDMNLTDKDLKKYFTENEKYFKTVNYKLAEIPYGENGWFADAATAKSAAEVFKKVTTSQSFDECLTQFVSTLGGSEENAKQEVADALHNDEYYQDENKFMEWAFEKDRKALDLFIHDTGSAYNVYLLTGLPTLPEKEMRDVRHILLKSDSFDSDDAAKAEADKILKEYRAGKQTEDAFAALAKKYSEDAAENGGLYENVSKGEMVETFNDWLFAEDRKAGDVDVVKTEYGYHVMYYVGEGQKLWEVSAENALISKKLDDLCKEYIKIWPITTHDHLFKRIDL